MADRGVAIVIPALDEADNIGALLDDCAVQTLRPSQVIVVDAGSSDGTYELLRERAAEWPALEVHRVPGATPGAGRNEGIARSRADVLATLDAGSRVGPDWLASLVGALGHDGRRVAVGSSAADARTSLERATGWFTLRAFKPADRAGPLGRAFLPAGRNGYCFSREAWERAGGYPPDLPWGEDKSFLRRLREQGFEVVTAPDAVVRWRPRRSLGEFHRQYERYGRGDAIAGIDRQNVLVTLGLYVAGALLAARAAGGGRVAAWLLAAGVPGYFGLFTSAARRQLRLRDGLAWVPLLRLVADVAKMRGFLAVQLGRTRDRPRRPGR